MARPVRIHIPRATYLVQMRARPGVALFTSEEDRALFLHSIGETAAPTGVTVYAFSLLENSALLFLRAGDLPLSHFVHRTQAGYFNRLRVHQGESRPLIHDRHRAILVEEGGLFLPVLQRVHLAPIIGGHWTNQSEARKWGEVSTTRWTSFPIFTGRHETPDWFDREGILERFRGQNVNKPEEAFYRYIIEGVKRAGETDILDRVKAMSLLGSKEFVDRYYEGAKGRRRLFRANGNGEVSEETEHQFQRIVQIVAREFDTVPEELLKSRARHIGRKFLVELAMRHAVDEGGMKRLGQRLNVSGSALAHLHRAFLKTLEADPVASALLDRLSERIREE